MAQVSIANVDNLTDAVNALNQAYSAAQENFAEKSRELSELCELTEVEFQDAVHAVETATEVVDDLSHQLEALEAQLQDATKALSEAHRALIDAQSSLANCESSGSYDDDGHYEPPDCSCEEDNVSSAGDSAESSEQQVKELNNQINEIQETLEKARELLQKSQERAEKARENHMKSKAVCENYISCGSQMLAHFQKYVNSGIAHLNSAKQALDRYLAVNPQAAAFEKWVHWQPKKGQVISPGDMHDRLTLSPEQQKEFSQYLYERDKGYRNLVDTARMRFIAANGSAEKQKVLMQASRNLSGELAEKIVAYAFKPIGNVSTQSRTYFEDGKYTKTDLIVSDLKNVTVLGRGEGRSAPEGGSIAIEVKTGHAGYIAAQKDHMAFQAGGHQNSSCSMVICSRDIKDLSPDQEQKLRNTMSAAGSPIFGTLPRKDELDQTVWQAIANPTDTAQNT